MIDEARQRQLEAIITTAKLVSKDDANAISLLVGALTLACCRCANPIAALQISIDSVTQAHTILVVRGGGN